MHMSKLQTINEQIERLSNGLYKTADYLEQMTKRLRQSTDQAELLIGGSSRPEFGRMMSALRSAEEKLQAACR